MVGEVIPLPKTNNCAITANALGVKSLLISVGALTVVGGGLARPVGGCWRPELLAVGAVATCRRGMPFQSTIGSIEGANTTANQFL